MSGLLVGEQPAPSEGTQRHQMPGWLPRLGSAAAARRQAHACALQRHAPGPTGSFASARRMGRVRRSLVEPASVNSPLAMRCTQEAAAAVRLVRGCKLPHILVPTSTHVFCCVQRVWSDFAVAAVCKRGPACAATAGHKQPSRRAAIARRIPPLSCWKASCYWAEAWEAARGRLLHRPQACAAAGGPA